MRTDTGCDDDALGAAVANVHRKISECDVFKFSLFSINVCCVKILTSMN